MFIENRMLVRITDKDGKTFTGTLYETTIQPDLENNNKPEVVLFVDQDERLVDSEGEFGMLAILVSAIKNIEILDDEVTVKKIKKENEKIREKHKRKL